MSACRGWGWHGKCGHTSHLLCRCSCSPSSPPRRIPHLLCRCSRSPQQPPQEDTKGHWSGLDGPDHPQGHAKPRHRATGGKVLPRVHAPSVVPQIVGTRIVRGCRETGGGGVRRAERGQNSPQYLGTQGFKVHAGSDERLIQGRGRSWIVIR